MKKGYLFGALGLGLLFAGCQSDDIKPDSELSTDYARTFYVNLSIRTDGAGQSSRAGGDPTFDKGENESDINTAYFVFYDQLGRVVGGEPVEMVLNGVEWKEEANGGNIDKYCQSVVGVTVGNGSDNPAQVICYLNPKKKDSLSKPLSKIQEEARENGITVDKETKKKYFAMSNSVYYYDETSDAPQIAVPIAPNQLYNTRVAAEAALDQGLTVDIYVERYAAKLSFAAVDPEKYQTLSRSVTTGVETAVELTFVPKTWMLNASCYETYIIKSFREEDATNGNMLQDNYGYAELNSVINKNGGNWAWNNTGFHRSYWAMSPAYFTSSYPEVSADVKGLGQSLHQHYYSYNELLGLLGSEPQGFTLPGANEKVTEYVNETTVGSKAIASKNIVGALPSVIYVGDYTVKINGQELTETDFYTYGVVSGNNDKPVVYFDVKEGSSDGESAIAGGESILRALIAHATDLYKKVTVNGQDTYVNFDLKTKADLDKLTEVLELADLNQEDNEEIKGNLKVPERYRTLKFIDGVTAEQLDGIYVGTAQGYRTIDPDPEVTTPGEGKITLLMANQELMKVVGFAAKYNAGAAYFNIPVKHLGWYRSSNENNGKTEIDWSKIRVGDFGVVRNHSYDINVTEILGLGTGIGGKENPIVPPAEENRYYIAYRVNILQWAIVPTQNVKL